MFSLFWIILLSSIQLSPLEAGVMKVWRVLLILIWAAHLISIYERAMEVGEIKALTEVLARLKEMR